MTLINDIPSAMILVTGNTAAGMLTTFCDFRDASVERQAKITAVRTTMISSVGVHLINNSFLKQIFSLGVNSISSVCAGAATLTGNAKPLSCALSSVAGMISGQTFNRLVDYLRPLPLNGDEPMDLTCLHYLTQGIIDVVAVSGGAYISYKVAKHMTNKSNN